MYPILSPSGLVGPTLFLYCRSENTPHTEVSRVLLLVLVIGSGIDLIQAKPMKSASEFLWELLGESCSLSDVVAKVIGGYLRSARASGSHFYHPLGENLHKNKINIEEGTTNRDRSYNEIEYLSPALSK